MIMIVANCVRFYNAMHVLLLTLNCDIICCKYSERESTCIKFQWIEWLFRHAWYSVNC